MKKTKVSNISGFFEGHVSELMFRQKYSEAKLLPEQLIFLMALWKSSFFPPASLWAYQVTGIEFVRFAERFPQVSLPEDSGERVKRGFVAFRNVCMNCHAINGEGGKKARDLYQWKMKNENYEIYEIFERWARWWKAFFNTENTERYGVSQRYTESTTSFRNKWIF